MKIQANYCKHTLKFKKPAQTSRDTLVTKPVYYLILTAPENGREGIGECTTIPGLSIDHRDDYEAKIGELCKSINQGIPIADLLKELAAFPSVKFGLETAFHDLKNGGKRLIFDTPFAHGDRSIPINGLVWMGDFEAMKEQINDKLEAGFDCIKLKIGAIDWAKELQLLNDIRALYDAETVSIRVDANGAFEPDEAAFKLEELSEYAIHSIEQPVKPGNWVAMEKLCKNSPVPIALDEELIGAYEKAVLLDALKPQFLIIKPGLIGGIGEADEWVDFGERRGIGWWATSALESNIGLNAIAQWTDTYDVNMPQGLGTGGLYTNNIPAPLLVENGVIKTDPRKSWDLSILGL